MTHGHADGSVVAIYRIGVPSGLPPSKIDRGNPGYP
jgi:hypothetical protein